MGGIHGDISQVGLVEGSPESEATHEWCIYHVFKYNLIMFDHVNMLVNAPKYSEQCTLHTEMWVSSDTLNYDIIKKLLWRHKYISIVMSLRNNGNNGYIILVS